MKRIVTGIDIGGTKIRGVLWDGKKVLKAKEAATPKNLADFKSALIKLVESLGGASKVSIGAAGLTKRSILIRSRNIPYIKHFDFSKMKGISFHGALDNDARCFARAEYAKGSAAAKKKAFFITLGTGVGRAVGRNGKILRIKKFEHAERWETEYQKLRDSKNNKKLAKYLSKKIAKLIKPYRPQTIIIGGSVSTRKGFFTEFKQASGLPLKKSKFGKNAIAIGAAELL